MRRGDAVLRDRERERGARRRRPSAGRRSRRGSRVAAGSRAARRREPASCGGIGEEVAHAGSMLPRPDGERGAARRGAARYRTARGRRRPCVTRWPSSSRRSSASTPSTRRGTRRARRSSCATTSSRTASSAGCSRGFPSGRISSRGSRGRDPDGAAAPAALAHGHRARRSRPSGPSDPWSGELRDGQVWGRGALDMKGQVAANAVAIATLAREGFEPAGDLIFAATADEEVGDDFGLSWLCEEHPEAVRADLVHQRGRRRPHRRRRPGPLPLRDRGEGELAVPHPGARQERARLDARHRATTRS